MDGSMKAYHVDRAHAVQTSYQGMVTALPGDWIVTNEKMEVIVVNDETFHQEFKLGTDITQEDMP